MSDQHNKPEEIHFTITYDKEKQQMLTTERPTSDQLSSITIRAIITEYSNHTGAEPPGKVY